MKTPIPKTRLPQAVLFDYDGVLVASEPIHLLAWLQLQDELGLPQDRKAIERQVGKTAPETLAALLDQYKPGWTPEEYPLNHLAQRKNDIYLSLAPQQLRIYPGVIEGIQWLRSRGVALAVVSNGRRRELEATMKFLGLFDLMDHVVSRDDAKAAKPDPTPYLFAAALLGKEVHECVAIEDSPTGLEAALMAKIPVAGVTTNFSEAVLKQPVPGRPDLKPVWIGPSIHEFFRWLAE